MILNQYRRPRAGRALLEQPGVGAPAPARRQPISVPAEFRDEIDRAASRSCGVYRDLVDVEGFVEFFRQVSPVDELAELTIGSRPASRRAGGSSRTCAQSVGVRVDAEPDPAPVVVRRRHGARGGDLECQREMWHSWPFFRMACSTLEMALFKVDLSVGRRYLALVDDGLAVRFWPELEAEHGRVVARLLAIRDGEALLDGTPALRDRLSHRNR